MFLGSNNYHIDQNVTKLYHYYSTGGPQCGEANSRISRRVGENQNPWENAFIDSTFRAPGPSSGSARVTNKLRINKTNKCRVPLQKRNVSATQKQKTLIISRRDPQPLTRQDDKLNN